MFESNPQFSRVKESLRYCNTHNRVATFREHGAQKHFSRNLKPPFPKLQYAKEQNLPHNLQPHHVTRIIKQVAQ